MGIGRPMTGVDWRLWVGGPVMGVAGKTGTPGDRWEDRVT